MPEEVDVNQPIRAITRPSGILKKVEFAPNDAMVSSFKKGDMDITLAKNQESGKIAVVSRHQSGVIRAVVMDQKTG